MSGSPPSSSATPAPLPWQTQAVWVAPEAADVTTTARMTTYPPQAAARERFLVTNEPERLRELLRESEQAAAWHVVSIAELYFLLRPDAPAENVGQMLMPADASESPERALWRLWRDLARDLAALPRWALEAASALCSELNEEPIARLLRHCAAETRQRTGQGDRWSDTFPATVKRVERPAPPAFADCTALDPEVTASLLAPDGALARLVSGYEPRAGQLAMLRAVVEAFNGGHHLLVEAGTGVGKSLAYLLPSALWARLNDTPVVISTNTRNLQTQLVEKDLPAVLRLLDSLPAPRTGAPRSLRTALIKGRSNYLCLRRLGALLDQGQFELQRHELRQFARVICWAVRTPDGDLDRLGGGVGVEPSFLPLLSSISEECPGRGCRYYRRCFLQQARARALGADLVVANHALVFAELGAGGISLPKHSQLVFDEAHNLEEAATRHFSIECSPARLRTLLIRLTHGRGARRGGLLETLKRRLADGAAAGDDDTLRALRRALREASAQAEELRQAGRHFFQGLALLLPANGEALRYVAPPDFREAQTDGGDTATTATAPAGGWPLVRFRERELRTRLRSLQDILRDLIEATQANAAEGLNLLAEEILALGGVLQALVALESDIDMVLAGKSADHVYWLQRARTRAAQAEAWAAPLSIGPLLAQHLYEQRQSVIFCSATMSVGGSFRYIGERLGLDRIAAERLRTCIASSPFDYTRQCLLLAPSYLPEPNAMDRSHVAELALLMRRIAVALDGRTLMLFTSYEMLRQCAQLLEAPLKEAGIRLLAQGGSGSRDQILSLFRRGQRCVLLGTHSFWEGVDVVGEALSCVMLARLPFTAPGEPIFSARCERLARDGHSSFGALALPAAVLRLRQGFGRLIRHRQDRGIVIVADTRLLTKGYGAVFRRSLPCPTIACPDAASVLAQVKTLIR